MPVRRARTGRPAEVACTPGIMSEMPCVLGTRVPAMTIVAEIRAGSTRDEILQYCPTLPLDAIKAVRRWAVENGISLEPQSVKR